jgi:hypothetical protein
LSVNWVFFPFRHPIYVNCVWICLLCNLFYIQGSTHTHIYVPSQLSEQKLRIQTPPPPFPLSGSNLTLAPTLPNGPDNYYASVSLKLFCYSHLDV